MARVFKRGQRGLSEVGALEARVFKWGRKGHCDARPGMHESTPAEECVRSKSWSVPAHVSIGYIIRGLADAPSPEGEGRRESVQPQGEDGIDDAVVSSVRSHWGTVGIP